MRDLNYQLKQLCRRNRDGSYATQADRERMLALFANQLHEMGFRHLRADSLKPKHVQALLERSEDRGHLDRHPQEPTRDAALASREGRQGKRGRPRQRRLRDRAAPLRHQPGQGQGPRPDQGRRGALALRGDGAAAAGGLRAAARGVDEDPPGWADQGNALVLKASWTKGGRERELPIRTDAQREVLNDAKKLAAGGSLIPQGWTYKEQLNAFKAECQRAGINKVHGLRHRYAQTRYLEKTGWACPARGGPTKKQLTPDQRSTDQRARLEISLELGHGRGQVTTTYLGR